MPKVLELALVPLLAGTALMIELKHRGISQADRTEKRKMVLELIRPNKRSLF